jgi:hypothetical protein
MSVCVCRKFISYLARFRCVAMSRRIRVTLAAAKGMSSSSVKPEYIAVQ